MEQHQEVIVDFDMARHKNLHELTKIKEVLHEMTSSTISATSSLASPGDSGVQCLDSEESEITSVMSASGLGCDIIDSAEKESPSSEQRLCSKNERQQHVMTKSDIANQNVNQQQHEQYLSKSVPLNYFDKFAQQQSANILVSLDKSRKDVLNKSLSDEVFEMEHPINNAMEKDDDDEKQTTEADLMNVSLNSYELLDYTMQNKLLADANATVMDQMHVSMSEEVGENLKVPMGVVLPIVDNVNVVEKPVEDQIVFRRQRKKKSKSDTPKKRVSFHEDILNSTKIDDIHINHGFITHELQDDDVSFSFFQRGFSRKPDVVKGRYSWAAEGDAPFYEKKNERETKSDLYINATNSTNNANQRFSSTSSSSNGSISSSSIDEEEDSSEDSNGAAKKPPSTTTKQPKSSCLKKTTPKKYIDTNIVEEEMKNRKRRSDSNLLLLDGSNIFGSLKNILNFSTSVPLAERGVPEGQEDYTTIYASSHEANRRKSCTNFNFKNFEALKADEPAAIIEPTVIATSKKSNKPNLKLTASEGFYPNYPANQNLPSNIIVCDSNVYEHKGISYSYEYDKFQKSFEQQTKPKSSTVYQMILKEFNFFRKKAKEPADEMENADDDDKNDFEIIPNANNNVLKAASEKSNSVEEVEEVEVKSPPAQPANVSLAKSSSSKLTTNSKFDWSDNETILSDLSLDQTCGSLGRHLHSPKKKINPRSNHYALSPFKLIPNEKSHDDDLSFAKNSRPPSTSASTSKSSLINRFLRNVTMKKMIDIKAQNSKQQKLCRKYLGLYVKNHNYEYKGKDEVDEELEREILIGKEQKMKMNSMEISHDFVMDGSPSHRQKLAMQLKKELFRSRLERLLKIFPVRSAYATNGHSRPLLVILTDTTLYIAGIRSLSNSSSPSQYYSQTNTYCNHFVLPYTELNTILIGPSAQTIHFSNCDKDMQCIITTGCSRLTGDLIGQLELAMRRNLSNNNSIICKARRLAAVKQLTMRDMNNLRRAICKQTAVDQDEEYLYYSIVNIQDFNPDITEVLTPLGPNKEGPLMFKTSDAEARWETAYFILKAGVLYMLSSASQRVPMRVFPLINGSCQGARRVYNCPRPHTFQLIIEGRQLHLAAPDEYVASEWLQCLVHSASGGYNIKEKMLTQSCSLLMTTDHILTVREAFSCTVSSLLPPNNQHQPIKGPQVLSCAAIVDLVAFRLPSAEQSWCVLEFSCREVHECSGDWILYFSTNVELENFISTLELLWSYNNENGDSFPLSTIPESDPLSKKCVDIYKSLKSMWPSNLVHLQFL